MLVQYVRNARNHPIGVVVSTGPNTIGWSLLNKKDHWDREKGIFIARNRAENGFNSKIPHAVIPVFDKMLDRMERYYKEN